MYVMFIVPFAVICFMRRVWCVRSLLPTYTSLYPACFMQYFFYLPLFLFHCPIFPFFGAWTAIAGGLKLKSIRGQFFFIFISLYKLLYFHTKYNV